MRFFKTLILILSFSLFACIGIFVKKPLVSLEEIKVNSVSLKGLGFSVGLEVSNPNPFSVTLKELNYSIWLNQEEVAKGRTDQEIKIEKGSKHLVSLPLFIEFSALQAFLGSLKSGEEINYRVVGQATIRSFWRNWKFRFQEKKGIKIPGLKR